jgi:hypothetical protein
MENYIPKLLQVSIQTAEKWKSEKTRLGIAYKYTPFPSVCGSKRQLCSGRNKRYTQAFRTFLSRTLTPTPTFTWYTPLSQIKS